MLNENVYFIIFNFQELVNKELWDKNKQIERLELRLAAQGAVCESKEGDLKEAKRKLAEFGVSVTSLGPVCIFFYLCRLSIVSGWNSVTQH